MKKSIIMFTLLLVSSSCFAQNELKSKEDSIESQVKELKAKLNYGEDKLTASIEHGVNCKVIKAYYYDDYQLIVELQFLSEDGNPKLEFREDNGYSTTNFCLLAEKHLKVDAFDVSRSEINLKLEEGISKNMTVHFTILNIFKGPKPRLIEYLKLTVYKTEQEFIFRNIPIDYDEDK